MNNRVCLLVAGCSTKSSFLAPMSLSQTLQGEVGAVVIGAGILACGNDIDLKAGTISSEIQTRLNEGARLLAAFASVCV